ncbi:MAG: serine hydrolase [bacterium]|nr:serine hydrolase [bacterium]
MNRFCRALVPLLILLFVVFPATAKQSRQKKPHCHTYPSLLGCSDPVLQQGLESCVADLGLEDAVRDKSLCVALVDITDLNAPRLAALNGDEMKYAASLPKIALLLGAFEKSAQGDLELDEKTCDTLTCMIRNSSNSAATQILNRIGADYLAGLLQSPRYRLYDRERNGGLWVGKEYGRGPAWKRDPLHNISHGATALQVARFYYLLETGRLVSPEKSRQMKEMLGRTAIQHKFVKGLAQAKPGSAIYRKSGTWRQFHADSAIIERDNHRYIAVALAENPQGGDWLTRLIIGMDDLIFQTASGPVRLSRLRETSR